MADRKKKKGNQKYKNLPWLTSENNYSKWKL